MNFVEILLVEDSAGDARLVKEVLKDSKIHNNISHVEDGDAAIQFLRKQGQYKDVKRPDLILLDLNLPKKDGRDVLKEIKGDEDLRRIPVVVITTSKSEEDVLRSYNLHANSYVQKPMDFEQFVKVVRNIEEYWFSIVKLPDHKN